MKTLLTLLAFYMLALQMMPCADAFGMDLPAYSQNRTEDAGLDVHSDENDLCPPFCMCNCCGMISGILLYRHVYDLKSDPPFDQERSTYYKPNFTPGYLGKIWQPPKFNA